MQGDQGPTQETAAAEGDGDVAELRAEVDALQAQVAELQGAPPKHRARSIGAVALVILFAISFLAASVGIWVKRNTLNEDVWAERVVPLGEDPRVQAALATWTTDQLIQTVDPQKQIADILTRVSPRATILAGPMSSALEDYVRGKVEAFFASDRFEEIWAFAVTQAHAEAVRTLRGDQEAVSAQGDDIVINMIPLIDAVLNEILKEAPGLIGSNVKLPKVSAQEVPAAARARLAKALNRPQLAESDWGIIRINDGGALASSQEAVKIFDKVVVLAVLLTLLTGAGALALSPRRRRTLLQMVGAAAVVCVIVRRASFAAKNQVDQLVKVDTNKGAADAVVSTFVDPLTNSAAIVLWALAAIALIAVLTGPYDWAVRLRHAVFGFTRTAGTTVRDRARDEQTLVWIVDHADLLKVAGYVLGVLLLWWAPWTWWSILLIAALVAAWQLVLARIVGTGPPDEGGGADGSDGTSTSGSADPAAPAPV